MALRGQFKIFGVLVDDAYIRIKHISGGKQSGSWTADISVYANAKLLDAVVAARADLHAAESATFETGKALSSAENDADLISAFETAKRTEYVCSSALEKSVSILGDPLPLGQVQCAYDANIQNPYRLLYSMLKAQENCSLMVDQ